MSNPDQLHGTIAKGPLHAIHASPAVRDALLDYHERPADDEAAAVVAAISAAIAPAEHARLLAEQVLSIDMVSERGLKAKELARAVLGEAQESPAELALRSLASWLGVGGYNASAIDAKTMERRIRDGVAQLMAIPGPEISEAAAMAAAVPAGWKLVPEMPTKEMLVAAGAACEGRMYPASMTHGPRAQNTDRYIAMLDAAPKAPVAGQPAEPSHIHRKSGGRYTLLGQGRLQCDTPLADMAEIAIYRGEDGLLWARDAVEFAGRFDRAAPKGDSNG